MFILVFYTIMISNVVKFSFYMSADENEPSQTEHDEGEIFEIMQIFRASNICFE